MAQTTTQVTPTASRSNLILVGTLSVAVAIGAAAIGHHLGYQSGFADGLASVLDTTEDERPPIIVGNGGSVTIEAQLHPKGGGRGKIQKANDKYQHVDSHMKTKGLDLRFYGSSSSACQGTDSVYKKVTVLKILIGKDDTPTNWLMITFDDVDPTAGSDLQWTLDSSVTAALNKRGYLVELQGGMTPEWFLKRATFSDSSGSHTCDFAGQTGDQAILIEQRKLK